MKIRSSSYLFVAIMIIVLVIIVLSLQMEYVDSKVLPLIVASIVFVLAAIGLGRDILAGDERRTAVAEGDTGEREPTRKEWLGYLLNGAWVGGLVLGISLLGFIIAAPLFILAYMKWLGTRWRVAIIFTALTPILIYVIFELALGVDLYRGLLLAWLGY